MKNQVPPQVKGAESVAISTIELPTEKEAKLHFQTVKKRFLDINSWELFAGKEKAEFTLYDAEGNLSLKKPEIGNFVSIKIPLLHNLDEDGLDWVRVEVCEAEIADDHEEVYIRLRPTSNPNLGSDKTVHFLNDDSTSNFFVRRTGKIISAEIYARNEVPNTKDKTVVEKVRNKLVAFGGMVIGSKLQWEGLTDGLIKNEE